jgi:DNA-binding winged helix-turn-helix (wHTH) protein/Tol biopolymer transport system component
LRRHFRNGKVQPMPSGAVGSQPGDRRQFSFGGFRLDLNAGLLRRGEDEIALRPKSFEVLGYLVQHHGRVVSREELMSIVWRDVAVTDESVTKCIADIRKALGDDDQQLVRTVARRGYLLTVAVTTPTLEFPHHASRDTELGPVAIPAAHETVNKLRGGFRWAGAGAAITLAAAGGISLLPFGAAKKSPGIAFVPEFTQITNFTDSAYSPALSADGRMLAFIRGENLATLGGIGDIYIKLLPDGEPVRLTHDGARKMAPVFTPAGDRVAYGVLGLMTDPKGWTTWTVSVFGGEPRPFLANASGLTWIPSASPARVMFSEVDAGIHMPVVTSAENHTESRIVYSPAGKAGMAHRSYLSPDGRHVLIVEMDGGGWRPCRLVPYEAGRQTGIESGREVGPSPGLCSAAAWSPDGTWMYLTVNTGDGYHIWRQRFPDGQPEQVTSGATEERELVFAPDGKSFFTSAGTVTSTLWVHDRKGERQITSEGYAFLPQFSSDGKKLYYLQRSKVNRRYVSGVLWVSDLETGQRERLLPGFVLEDYRVSADGKRIVYVATAGDGASRVWLSRLDGRTAPRLLSAMEADRAGGNPNRAFFGPQGEVFFSAAGESGGSACLYRVKEDGTGLAKANSPPFTYVYDVSPDGKTAAAWFAAAVQVFSIDGGEPLNISTICAAAGGEQRGIVPPCVSWSPDGAFLYLYNRGARLAYAAAIPPGRSLPGLPAGGIGSAQQAMALPGARVIREQYAFLGPNPSVYAFFRTTSQRNIYRVRVQ